jgi:hypothetical protein
VARTQTPPEDGSWTAALADPPDWEAVVRLHNEEYDDDPDDDDDERLYYDAESGRPYVWSTENLEGEFDDWWVATGCYGGELLSVPAAEWTDVIHERPCSCGAAAYDPGTGGKACAGGPIRFLDLDTPRDRAAEQAATEYDLWLRVCAETPDARSLGELIRSHGGELTSSRAYQAYQAQPRIVRASKDAHLVIDYLGEEPGAVAGAASLPDRETFIAQVRNEVLAWNALVTLDGEWLTARKPDRYWEPGVPGAHGARASFGVQVADYLGSISPDSVLVAVHCHF